MFGSQLAESFYRLWHVFTSPSLILTQSMPMKVNVKLFSSVIGKSCGKGDEICCSVCDLMNVCVCVQKAVHISLALLLLTL